MRITASVLTTLFLFLILASGISAQGEFVEEKIKAIGLGTTFQKIEGTSVSAIGVTIGSTSPRNADVGVNMGFLSSGNGKYISPYLNVYLMRQLKGNKNPFSFAVNLQPTAFIGDYNSTLDFSIGAEMFIRLKPENSSFTVQPVIGVAYSSIRSRILNSVIFGTSIYQLMGKQSVGVSVAGYYSRESGGNYEGAGVSISFFIVLFKDNSYSNGDYHEEF